MTSTPRRELHAQNERWMCVSKPFHMKHLCQSRPRVFLSLGKNKYKAIVQAPCQARQAQCNLLHTK